VPERQQHLSAILRRPASGLPGRDEVSGEAASRLLRGRGGRQPGAPGRRPADVAAAIVYLAGAGFVTGTVLECAGCANLTVGAMAS
jgi:hypothetical protein